MLFDHKHIDDRIKELESLMQDKSVLQHSRLLNVYVKEYEYWIASKIRIEQYIPLADHEEEAEIQNSLLKTSADFRQAFLVISSIDKSEETAWSYPFDLFKKIMESFGLNIEFVNIKNNDISYVILIKEPESYGILKKLNGIYEFIFSSYKSNKIVKQKFRIMIFPKLENFEFVIPIHELIIQKREENSMTSKRLYMRVTHQPSLLFVERETSGDEKYFQMEKKALIELKSRLASGIDQQLSEGFLILNYIDNTVRSKRSSDFICVNSLWDSINDGTDGTIFKFIFDLTQNNP